MRYGALEGAVGAHFGGFRGWETGAGREGREYNSFLWMDMERCSKRLGEKARESVYSVEERKRKFRLCTHEQVAKYKSLTVLHLSTCVCIFHRRPV